jgi:GntR family transcriptional regulator
VLHKYYSNNPESGEPSVNFQENIPIYVQIANDIKDQIIAGKLIDGDKLSSIREYSITYEVTSLTMQRALALLESDAVIETKKGVGSFVKAGVREELKVKLVEVLVRDFIARAANMGITDEEILKRIKNEIHKKGVNHA